MNIEHLNLELPAWALPPSLSLVEEYEREFDLKLPADYRGFLAAHGGALVNATCPFMEPTPLGDMTPVDQFYGFMQTGRSDDVRQAARMIDGAPDVVAVASDLMGGMLWMKCTGDDTGCIYFHDPQQRWTWPDEQFRRTFRLAPSIERYLELRTAGSLPKKKRGYENVYLVARSFSDLIEKLVQVEDVN